jgi:hypothetical protein
VGAPRVVAAVEAGLMMQELSHCCDGGRVDDIGDLRAIAATEAGSKMQEPLEPLLRLRWGR